MPLGRPVVPPEKRIAAASSVRPAGSPVAGAAAARSADQRRMRGSAGSGGILRPLVTQKPSRLSGERYSGMRATRIFSSGRLGVAAASGAVEGVEDERHARARGVEEVRDLRRRRQGMDERRKRSQPVGRVEGDDALRRRGHGDEEAIARAQPLGREGGGAAVHRVQELAVGRLRAQEVPGHRLRHAPRGGGERPVERDARVVDRGRHAPVEAQPGTLVHRISTRAMSPARFSSCRSTGSPAALRTLTVAGTTTKLRW